jgi:hypothetical protein
MVLKYLSTDMSTTAGPPEKPEKRVESSASKTSSVISSLKKPLFYALFLANLLVLIATYNVWTSEKVSFTEAIAPSSVIRHVSGVIKNTDESQRTKVGMVTGIIYSAKDSTALLNGEIVCEGSIVRGVRIVKIHRNKVEFEKNGRTWYQGVMAKPDPGWW